MNNILQQQIQINRNYGARVLCFFKTSEDV